MKISNQANAYLSNNDHLNENELTFMELGSEKNGLESMSPVQ